MSGGGHKLAAAEKDYDSGLSGLFASSLARLAPISRSHYAAGLRGSEGIPGHETDLHRPNTRSWKEGEPADARLAFEPGLRLDSGAAADPEGAGGSASSSIERVREASDGQTTPRSPGISDAQPRQGAASSASSRKRKPLEKIKLSGNLKERNEGPKRRRAQASNERSNSYSVDADGLHLAQLPQTSTSTAVEDDDSENDGNPVHESLFANDRLTTDLGREARTVFLGNVSIEAITSQTARKALLQFLSSAFQEESGAGSQRVETLRFRSIPFSTSSMPKRAAYITKSLMSATTRSCNAYAVFSDVAGAQQAVSRLNGTVVLGRHLRVDSAANPTAVVHRRCVFVGNLNFVDDETVLSEDLAQDGETSGSRRKGPNPPLDIEEGLWAVFSAEAGPVESVRVVRDQATRVGKGFAYVQFLDENAVEAALLMSGKKYPPLLPRKLRVGRCRPPSKKGLPTQMPVNRKGLGRPPRSRVPGMVTHAVEKGKSHSRIREGHGRRQDSLNQGAGAKITSPDSFVFEGRRAKAGVSRGHTTRQQRPDRARNGKKGLGRGAKRAAEWRSAGRQKS